MAIESLVRKNIFLLVSKVNVVRGRQICCTESFFNLFLKCFLKLKLVLLLTYLNFQAVI
jgi:hypothetical protein